MDSFGPQFETPEEYVSQAIERVFSRVEVARANKEGFARDFMAAHRNGCPREEQKAALDHLLESGWRWPEYEEWKGHFQRTGVYPYMWADLKLGLNKKSFEECISEYTKAGILEILEKKGISAEKNAKKPALIQLALKAFSVEDAQKIIDLTFQEDIEYFEADEDVGKCKLLAHFTTMLSYSIRNQHQAHELGSGFALEAEGIKGCIVEEEFCAKWNAGQLRGYPPFFPGDRSSVSARWKGV